MSHSVLHSSKLSWRKRSIDSQAPLHPLDPSILALIQGLVSACRELSLCAKPIVCQRINARNICRRASALCPLFEELRDSGVWIPPSALSSFRDIRTAFRSIKSLLHYCRHTSSLLLLMQQDPLASQFHSLSSSIASSLSCLPYDLLEISLETREHLSLLQKHASRSASPFIDPAEKLLEAEILRVLASFEDQVIPEEEKLRELFAKLNFKDAKGCERELWLLEKEREKLRENNQYEEIQNVQSLMSLIRYGRCMLYGLGPEQKDAIAFRKNELTCGSMKKVVLERVEERDGAVVVPDDFRCPISLELMVDPVAIASGQTYERSSIARWLDEGNTSCPKTGLKLLHNTLIPNSSLRRLIAQWCAENDYVLDIPDHKLPSSAPGRSSKDPADLPSSKAAIEATKLTAEFLVRKLSIDSPAVQRQAAYELRLLAKDGGENRSCIAAAGAVPLLAALVPSADQVTQENAVTALLNLSINEKNKDLIVQTDGLLKKIVGILAPEVTTTPAARENAVAVLYSLTTVKAYRSEVGGRAGAMDGLLRMLRDGSPRGVRDAALTLFNLALDGGSVAELLQKGAVLAAVEALERDDGGGVADEVAALLAVLARRPDGLAAVSVEVGRVVAPLVQLLSEGSNKGKEYSAVILLGVCSMLEAGGNSAALRHQLRRTPSLFPSLRRLLVGGTPRAQRKAACLLKLLHRYPHTIL